MLGCINKSTCGCRTCALVFYLSRQPVWAGNFHLRLAFMNGGSIAEHLSEKTKKAFGTLINPSAKGRSEANGEPVALALPAFAGVMVELEEAVSVVSHKLQLDDQVANVLFLFDLLVQEPLKEGLRGEILFLARQFKKR